MNNSNFYMKRNQSMKRLSLLTVVLLFALILTACGSNTQSANPEAVSESTPASGDTGISTGDNPDERIAIDYGYENPLSTRLMLAFGSLRLAETSTPITGEQAPEMLMLWQALDNLTNSGTSAEEEVNALLTQIELGMTNEQVAAINAMKLTQVDLQTWAKVNGLTVGSGTGLEQGSGQGRGMSPEARATKQAENGMTGTTNNENGLSSAVTTALITYLESIK
jgi:hypothetical protein